MRHNKYIISCKITVIFTIQNESIGPILLLLAKSSVYLSVFALNEDCQIASSSYRGQQQDLKSFIGAYIRHHAEVLASNKFAQDCFEQTSWSLKNRVSTSQTLRRQGTLCRPPHPMENPPVELARMAFENGAVGSGECEDMSAVSWFIHILRSLSDGFCSLLVVDSYSDRLSTHHPQSKGAPILLKAAHRFAATPLQVICQTWTSSTQGSLCGYYAFNIPAGDRSLTLKLRPAASRVLVLPLRLTLNPSSSASN